MPCPKSHGRSGESRDQAHSARCLILRNTHYRTLGCGSGGGLKKLVESPDRIRGYGWLEMASNGASECRRILRTIVRTETPCLLRQQLGVAETIRKPRETPAQHRLDDGDAEELMPSGRQDPPATGQLEEISLPVIKPLVTDNSRTVPGSELDKCLGHTTVALAEETEFQPIAARPAIDDLKQLIGSLVMLESMRPANEMLALIIIILRLT